MKTILCFILSIFLTGCACFKNPDVTIPPESVVKLDKAVLEPCDLLDENIQIASFDEAILAYAGLSMKYGTCAGKQNVSVKLLKQFSNVGDKK